MAIFEINKRNLIYNISKIRENLSKGVKFCAMMKADAYGHGAKIVSKIIEPYIDYFGVATVDEGIELRRNGCVKPILCVGKVFEFDYKKASFYDIEIMIDDYADLQMINKLHLSIGVHLKIDLGMHRLGFIVENQFRKSIRFVKLHKNIKLVGVFSHFAECGESFYNEKQKQFNNYLKMSGGFKNKVIKHISNSLACEHKALQYDMVRVGLSMYGYGESGLKKVLRIKSKIISLRNVKAGECVGYDGTYKCENDSIIATIFLGYYDGVNRKLSNQCYVKIKSRQYPIVGNICMDMFMVKVDGSVCVGDEVIVCDNADYWASLIGTIPYEVLTSLKSHRMQIEVVE